MAKSKKLNRGIFIASIVLLVLCVCFDVYYLYFSIFADDKRILDVFEIGQIETIEGDKYNVIEVKYYTNDNNNGYEMFEVKYTSMLDRNKEEIYSQGLQFLAKEVSSSLTWWDYEDFATTFEDYTSADTGDTSLAEVYQNGVTTYLKKKTGALFWQTKYYASYITPQINDKYMVSYNYASTDNFVTSVESTTYPLEENPSMLVNIGEDDYLIELRGNNYISKAEIADDMSYIAYDGSSVTRHRYYRDYNYYTMAYELFNAIQSLPNGTQEEIIIPFSDEWFDYSSYNEEDSSYHEITDRQEYAKITRDIKNYYSIKVTKSADGAQYYGDSLFGKMFNSTNFSIRNDIDSSDYFYGRPVIDCNIENFQFVAITDNYVALKLKEDFIARYLPLKDYIYIRINLTSQDFFSRDVRFAGYCGDCGLEDFNIINSALYPFEEVDWW